MIKTEKLVKHTICCPHCNGKIVRKEKISDEFEALFMPNRRYSNFTNEKQFVNVKSKISIPTCSNCYKQFEVKLDVASFTIEIKDV